MKFTEEVLIKLGWSDKSGDFVVGKEKFSDLQINPTPAREQFFYFSRRGNGRLIKQFILQENLKVDYICVVSLIKKANKFTPRLAVSVRDKTKQIIENAEVHPTNIKANVDLGFCHENFWQLINFLRTLKEIEMPKEKFSLISQDEEEIVSALRGRGSTSVTSIIRQLFSSPDISLTQKDMHSLMKRRERVEEFESALLRHPEEESWWQDFFKKNKWIFGYGLNYEILKEEQSQPHYGGTRLDGTGGQRGDYLMSTAGDLSFTVLVEIKTPNTQLLRGNSEIRNGAWSLSGNLIDALSQIQVNIQTWEKYGSEAPDNRDRFESESVYTVKPKGIIVIGSLNQFGAERHKLETFQRFRKAIHGVDIITFDELFKRARFIVENE